ncbi:MAG TPA: methylmalonyl Co-A mutase-associated GTPase MeaB [Anaerolineae bacterium]|nr:methylmalonyl Co-A mutase-associated GTPase MeaB [Anaerolineae bacterium]HOR00690.1 methylmalonyl Co-A mutase-associated GTPase MeaB [Anaerolineae bacterium]HPL27260.1 methylmalonyl Co-A mutase-associated GTPase MeaB [Anaerolineae bacterium]HPL27263.1 methylmalonyl Co-A mutase-associated GTPase MeaB [Anaerolineae bacterium]
MPAGDTAAALVERLLQGDRRALAQAITCVENGETAAGELLAALYPHGGRAHVIGVTGSPGTGKSTLVGALARAYRGRGLTVGILAIDPSSPFTGGALLGDRLRMRDLAGDAGIFIRSMATRGSTGGLSRMAADAVHAIDAAGFQRIIIETVGAGQDEVEVARLAHTVIVVEAPGLGDDIQAIKAGILETADILLVNKADREGAEQTIAALRMMLELRNGTPAVVAHHGAMMAAPATAPSRQEDAWQPPLIATVATEGRGIAETIDAIEAHRAHLTGTPEGREAEERRAEAQLDRALDEALRRLLAEKVDAATYRQAVEDIARRRRDARATAEQLVELLRSRGD